MTNLISYLRKALTIIFLLVLMACSKKERAVDQNASGGNDSGTSQSDTINRSPLLINKALFTNPEQLKIKSESPVIMDELINYLKCTPKGADVHISIFLFYYTPVVNAVKDAANRGVNVYLLIDSSEAKSKGSRELNKATISQLRYTFAHSDTKSKVIAVNNQITYTAINHEKIALFSEIDFPNGMAKDVVFVTSHNFIKSATKRAQDAIIMTNKPLYNIFLEHWNKAALLADKDMKNFEYEVQHLGDSLTVFFFPRRKDGSWDGKKTIVEQLDNLSNLDKDTILVLMGGWGGNRGMDIAKKLTSLYDQGANVEVITMNTIEGDIITELNKLHLPGGRLMLMNPHTMQNHSKTILIKGIWNGEKQTIIFTGSKNFYTGALEYSNNVVIKLKNSVLFDTYWKNFEELKTAFN